MTAALFTVCTGARHYFRKVAGRWVCSCGVTR